MERRNYAFDVGLTTEFTEIHGLHGKKWRIPNVVAELPPAPTTTKPYRRSGKLSRIAVVPDRN